MQQLVHDIPYQFIPPKYNALFTRLVKLWMPSYLKKMDGIASIETIGAEKINHSMSQGHGVMIASNHCRPGDPMTLRMGLEKVIPNGIHVMASRHLFLNSKVQGWLLPRVGAFSVFREGMDRESIECAVQILKEAKYPLLVFPEGYISRSNDQLSELMEGVSFICHLAAKQRAQLQPAGKVVVHPTFIRYHFEGDLKQSIEPVLKEIEKRLTWEKQQSLTLMERIHAIGRALLSLKELEHLGRVQEGTLAERAHSLLVALIVSMEEETGLPVLVDGSLNMERIKRIRTKIFPDLLRNDLNQDEKEKRWNIIAKLYLCQQLLCYPQNYLAGNPSKERILETVERYEEDLMDKCRPHYPIRAVIHVGDAIEVPEKRDKKAGDIVTEAIREQLEAMLISSLKK